MMIEQLTMPSIFFMKFNTHAMLAAALAVSLSIESSSLPKTTMITIQLTAAFM